MASARWRSGVSRSTCTHKLATLSREEEIVIADAAGVWRKTEQPCIKTPVPAPTKVPDGKCDGVDGGGGAVRGQMDSKLVPDEVVDSIEEK